MKKTPLLLLICTVISFSLFSQTPVASPLLSPDEAVRIALENNYDIRLVRADGDIARLNNTKGNAGLLPTVNLVVNETFTLSSFQQQLANDTKFDALFAPFNAANAAVQLSWTLFDGRRMHIAKKRLEELEALGQTNLQATVQQTIANVLLAYYDIVRSRLLERSAQEIIALNEERLRIAEARLAAGFAAQTDALQARIDLNQQRANLLAQQTATASAKRTLNRLLARASDAAFEVTETLDNTYAPDRARLLERAQKQNPQLLSLQKNASVAALLTDEARTLYKPRITGIGQVIVQRADNGAGFMLSNTQAGIVLGAALTVPLYTGGNIQRQIDVARVTAEQAVLRVDAQRLVVETELDNQLALFLAQKQVLVLETENVKNARESLNVSTERFRLGQTNALEVQSAQNTLDQALFRQNVVLYNLKAAELGLRLLAGEM